MPLGRLRLLVGGAQLVLRELVERGGAQLVGRLGVALGGCTVLRVQPRRVRRVHVAALLRSRRGRRAAAARRGRASAGGEGVLEQPSRGRGIVQTLHHAPLGRATTRLREGDAFVEERHHRAAAAAAADAAVGSASAADQAGRPIGERRGRCKGHRARLGLRALLPLLPEQLGVLPLRTRGKRGAQIGQGRCLGEQCSGDRWRAALASRRRRVHQMKRERLDRRIPSQQDRMERKQRLDDLKVAARCSEQLALIARPRGGLGMR